MWPNKNDPFVTVLFFSVHYIFNLIQTVATRARIIQKTTRITREARITRTTRITREKNKKSNKDRKSNKK